MEQQPERANAHDPELVAAAIRERRSINFFEPGEVARELILSAIEVARWAPNHRLTQPWRFYLIGPGTAEAIARYAAEYDAASKGERAGQARYQRLKGIPNSFVLTSRRNDDPLTEREDFAACCCAVQNLMIYLWQHGIGVKWTTGAITREARFYELAGIDPQQETIVGHFWYGRPKVITPQQRAEVAEIVTETP
jgi:nitroreductase